METGGGPMSNALKAQIGAVIKLSADDLRRRWCRMFRCPPPHQASVDFLRRAVVHRLQEESLHRLASGTRRRLVRLAEEIERRAARPQVQRPTHKPGTRLVREWQDALHEVEVLIEGYAYRGERYDSLSEIARQITGTRWNGPLFFGLRKSGAAKEIGRGR